MSSSFKLKPLPSKLFETAKDIVGHLKNAGYKAFLVGGCVRDTVMEISPKEYDITTSAKPEEIMRIFSNTIPIGASFGVILVLERGYKFEVATFRRDESYSDGRHPDKVTYSDDEREDVKRRDFTINGMLYDPMSEEVLDYVGGTEDIKNRIVRTIGNPYERFNEDKLRMIRAIRFAARFSYEIEKETLQAIKKLAPLISQVSAERIRDEIVKIITQRNPRLGLTMLRETGLLKPILPDVDRMHRVPQPPEFHPEGDVFIHTCLVLDKLYEITDGNMSPELAVGGLLHDVGKPDTFSVKDRIRFNGHDRVGAEMAKKICRRLKFSNKQIERIYSLVKQHLRFKDVFNMRESTLKRFIGMPHFEDHLNLHLADCLASHGSTEAYDFVKKRLEEFEEEEIRPKPLLSGYDLIEMGYTPGPIFSQILDSLEEAQLEGIVKDKEEAKRFVVERFPM
ncbi:MAG TPA: CCA tRNA nucleotidyltransferase [Thermodesulfobacteriota bacterium]|nr:CCA tRNA nucleotidyltransferase [Thermodesulfobacteriota bacterium]